MSGLFTPKRPDGRAYWRVAYDHLRAMQPGDTATHEELLCLLETDDRDTLYRAVARADQQLRKADHRAVWNVHGHGYRMLRADEHQARMAIHQGRAGKQIGVAIEVGKATDLAQLAPGARNVVLRITSGMVLLKQMLDQQADTIARHDELIHELSRRVTTLEGARPEAEVAS